MSFYSKIPFATRTSKAAAHSSADPRAIYKNLHLLRGNDLPLPSAMFSDIEFEAQSS
jgi:hypothetical protein